MKVSIQKKESPYKNYPTPPLSIMIKPLRRSRKTKRLFHIDLSKVYLSLSNPCDGCNDEIDWKLKIESEFKDAIWSCGCTRYLAGQCECGDQAWLVYPHATKVDSKQPAVKDEGR